MEQAGAKAIPHDSTTFKKEFYRPEDGMFAADVSRLDALHDVFAALRTAGRESRSDYQHGLMEKFDELVQVLTTQHKAQTEASIEAERHLIEAQSAQTTATALRSELSSRSEFLQQLNRARGLHGGASSLPSTCITSRSRRV